VYIGDNIKMYLKETGWEGEDWIHLVAWKPVAGLCECDYHCYGENFSAKCAYKDTAAWSWLLQIKNM